VGTLLNLTQLKSLEGPVLVTGHTGFKGSWLVELLRSHGVDVAGLALPPQENSLYTRIRQPRSFKEHFVDINNLDSLSAAIKEIKPGFIFHLAAQAIVLDAYQQPFNTYRTNVLGTLNLIEAVTKTLGCRGIQVVTTDKVYFNNNLSKAFVETDALLGTDPYSGSKVGTESVVSGLQKLLRVEHNILIQSVRAGNVIGGGDLAPNRLIPDLIRSYIHGNELIIRNPTSTRPWQHVLDPLLGYLESAENMLLKGACEPFNFGPAEPSLPVSEVLKLSLEYFPTKVSFNSSTIPKFDEARFLEVSPTKALLELNWMPIFTQEEAIKYTMVWWQKVLVQGLSAFDAMNSDIGDALERYAQK
jgi:CDP-glucose 4,6-dehydratase